MLKGMLGAAVLAALIDGAYAAGWTPSYGEEFTTAGAENANWIYETGYLRNNELQYYSNRAENSRSEGGALVIRALKDGWNGHTYTSASRTTRGKRSFKYGRFEMRARIDVRSGSWPAWWWLPDSSGWPKGGEIDMMEFYKDQCLFNVMDGMGKWNSPRKTVTSLGGARWAAEYHTWTMEWDSLRIDLSLDGALINHYDLKLADGTGPGGSNPFRHQGYMILNQAIGGNQGGDPAGTSFPVELRVDWIRVHRWAEGTGHILKVEGGAGSGSYLSGAQASVTAGLPPEGMVFDRWLVTSGSPLFDDITAPSARLFMPSMDVSVRASFKPLVTILRPRSLGFLTGPWVTPDHSAFSVLGRKGIQSGGNSALPSAAGMYLAR